MAFLSYLNERGFFRIFYLNSQHYIDGPDQKCIYDLSSLMILLGYDQQTWTNRNRIWESAKSVSIIPGINQPVKSWGGEILNTLKKYLNILLPKMIFN